MVGNRSDGNSPANVVIMEILSRRVASKLKLHLQPASCAPPPFSPPVPRDKMIIMKEVRVIQMRNPRNIPRVMELVMD